MASSEHASGDEIVLVVMLVLLVAAVFSILREKISSKFNIDIPFTVCMFATGLIFGGIMAASEDFADLVTITSISPKLIFDIFLPVLIFDGSQGIKLRTLSRVKWPAFWLAGPGLLIHTGLVGLFLWAFLGEWSWFGRLLLGAVLSATDPVAVIAVLKDLDADNTITTLIDGEAIANDGAAIILFTVFHPGTAGHTEDFSEWSFYLLLVWLVVGAPIVGTLFAMIIMTLLRQSYNQPVVEATLTLAGSYVAFIVAEDFLRTSGVLVLATLGYHLASHRGARLSRHSELAEHAWEVIVFFANAVIFALVGLIIGKDAIPAAAGFDWALLFILYVALHVFRAAVVGSFWKLLGDINFPRYVLLVFGALRGGVALSLALVIHRDEEIDETVRNQALFLTGGVVLLSIVVNGSISKLIVTKLGLNKQPGHKVYMKQRVEANLRYKAMETIRGVQGDASMKHCNEGVNWTEVYTKTLGQFHDSHAEGQLVQAEDVLSHHQDNQQEINDEEIGPEVDPNLGQDPSFEMAEVNDNNQEEEETAVDQHRAGTNGSGSADEENKNSAKGVMLKKIRTLSESEFIGISLRTMKSKLWTMRETDMIQVEPFELLLHIIDKHLDTSTFISPHEIHLAIQRKGCKVPLDLCGIATNKDIVYFESLLTFLELLECSEQVLQTMMPQHKRSKVCAATGAEDGKVLVKSMIDQFASEHEEIARGVRTNRLVLRTLQELKSSLSHMHEEQGVPKSAVSGLMNRIVDLAHSSAHRNVLDVTKSEEKETFGQCILFREKGKYADDQAKDQSSSSKKSIQNNLVGQQEALIDLAFSNARRSSYKEGDPIPLAGLGVVLKGSVVKKEVPHHYDYFQSDVFGLMQTLCDMDTAEYFAREDETVVAFIPEHVVLVLVNGKPSLLENLWTRYGIREAEAALSRYYPCCTFDKNDIRRIAANGVLRAFCDPHTIEPGSRSIFLLHGADETGTFSHRSLRLLPNVPKITFQKYTILFVIENFALNMGRQIPASIGIPLLDGAILKFEKALISLEEATNQGKDLVDSTLSLLMEYCRVFGCGIFFLLPHKSCPAVTLNTTSDGGNSSFGSHVQVTSSGGETSSAGAPSSESEGEGNVSKENTHVAPSSPEEHKKKLKKRVKIARGSIRRDRTSSSTTAGGVPVDYQDVLLQDIQKRSRLNPNSNRASRLAMQLAMNMCPASHGADGEHTDCPEKLCQAQDAAAFGSPAIGGNGRRSGGGADGSLRRNSFTSVEMRPLANNESFVPLATQEHHFTSTGRGGTNGSMTTTPEPSADPTFGTFLRSPSQSASPNRGGGYNNEPVDASADSTFKPLDPDEFLEEWRSFCRMLRRMILERFHLHSLEGRELLNNLAWWWKVMKQRQPQLAAFFAQHPELHSIHALPDLAFDHEVISYWKFFGFAMDQEKRTSLTKEEVDDVLDEIVHRVPTKHASLIMTRVV